MRLVVVPPDELSGDGPSLFLAGGITNTPVWQDEMIALLALDERWAAARSRSTSSAPGRCTRRLDVEIQTRLARPDVTIESSLPSLAARVTAALATASW